MPSIRTRAKVRSTGGTRVGSGASYTDLSASGFQTMVGNATVYKDLVFSWTQFFLGASSFNSASQAVSTISGSNLNALKFTNTLAGCPVWATLPIPKDAATSGSGTLWMDWTDPTTSGATVLANASVYLIPNGSAINAAGASTLGASANMVASGVATASAFNSSSLFQFNAPLTTQGYLAVKFFQDLSNASQTASAFSLFDIRLTYVSDRVGGSAVQ